MFEDNFIHAEDYLAALERQEEAEELAAIARGLQGPESIRRLLEESDRYDVRCAESAKDSYSRPRKNSDEAMTVR